MLLTKGQVKCLQDMNKVELPPDIHPLPDSVAAYVRTYSLDHR